MAKQHFRDRSHFVRYVDRLGRIVIPIEWRRRLGVETEEPVEITFVDDHIEMRAYKVGCVFCEATEDLVAYKGKFVCPECLRGLPRA